MKAKLITIAVVGALGLGYCAVFYHNGIDPLKDGTLVALLTTLTTIANSLTGESK